MGFRSALASFTGSVIRDSDTFQAEWDAHKAGATRRLGTVSEVRATINDLERAGERMAGVPVTLTEHCARHELGDTDPVGDPSDVHFIIEPNHKIGLAIEEGTDGYALETLELLKLRYNILRRKGTIVGIYWTMLGRHEQNGPIRVV